MIVCTVKLLKKGAEADIYLTEHRKRRAILKIRRRKPYINESLDERIRKTRTLREAQMISLVKEFGISAPLVLDLDMTKYSILMEYIPGTIVGSMRSSHLINACRKIGQTIALLHKNGTVHGDITTSNFIVSRQRLYVIDLGLGSRTQRNEDYAVDLRLFKEILNSAHATSADAAWNSFASGYVSVIGKAKFAKTSKIVADIESRGRYATVV